MQTIPLQDKIYAELNQKEMSALSEANAILNQTRNRAAERRFNKVALIQPRKGGRPSLGLLYIGAYLLDNGFDVKVFEFLDELYPPNVRYNKKIWKLLFDYKPDFIGFSVISSTCHIVCDMVSRITDTLSDVTLICGGKHTTVSPKDLLLAGVDYCTIGESEVTVVELLDAINCNSSIDNVQGIAYLRDDEVIYTESRSFLPLDYILRPAFELVDYKRYVDFAFQGIPGHYLKTGFIFGSRGCPYSCTFCTTHIRGSYRERSVDNLIAEMQWQISRYDIEAFVILDDLFYFKEDRVKEFCEKIILKQLNIKFFSHARVDRVNRDTLLLMKKAGLLMLAVGVESGSQKILDAINKKTTIPDIEDAYKIYNELGINTFTFIIVGHPEETDEDRRLTRELLKTIKPTHVAVSYYMPMPGTPSFHFEIQEAKYLLGGADFKAFSYTTDYPEFSNSLPLCELQEIGDEFTAYSTLNRNINLFKYKQFWIDILVFVLCHSWVLLEGFYLRYIIHKTIQRGLLSVIKDAIQFHKQKFV